MRWFWRMLIAVAVAYVFAILTLPLVYAVVTAARLVAAMVFHVNVPLSMLADMDIGIVQFALVWIVPVLIVGVLTFVAVTRWTRPANREP
jgi:hypothetical protein